MLERTGVIFAIAFVVTFPLSAATIDIEIAGTIVSTSFEADEDGTDGPVPQVGDAFSAAVQFSTSATLMEIDEDIWPSEGIFDIAKFYDADAVSVSLNGIERAPFAGSASAQLFIEATDTFSRAGLESDRARLSIQSDGIDFELESDRFVDADTFREQPIEDIVAGFPSTSFVESFADFKVRNEFNDVLRATLSDVTFTSTVSDEVVRPGPEPSPVPLPATFGFLLAGLIGLGLARKTRPTSNFNMA